MNAITFAAAFALAFSLPAGAAGIAGAAVPVPVPLPAAVTAITASPALGTAIVTSGQAPLRAAPRDSAQQQAQLWQGEMVEVRGERLDYLQVWDYRRERGGYVHASQLRRTALTADEAPGLLALLRHVAGRPGEEGLGIGLAAAYIKAAPAEALQGPDGVAAFDALGTLADRLARRASYGTSSAASPSLATTAAPAPPLSRAAESAIAAHLDVAARYGLRFTTYEQDGRMQVCYDGEAFRRVLALKSAPEQRARAALALTRPECADPALRAPERAQLDAWRAEVLDRPDTAALPGYLRNRVLLRRAGLWSSIAWQQSRQLEPAQAQARASAGRAIEALAGIAKGELTDDDLPAYNDAAIRAGAVRWAATAPNPTALSAKGVDLVTQPGQPGETCVLLVDAKARTGKPLAQRCTYAVVWPRSASFNREGTALTLAVQPLEAWRELWVFRKEGAGWTVNVLPPAAAGPGIGYAEFAGWVPGGTQVLVARESRAEGRYRHSFELVRVAGLTVERQAADPALLGAFQRWQDPAWKRLSVSVR